MFGQGVLWFQNKDKFIKITIGLTKPMREATLSGTFLMGQISWRIPKVVQALKAASRLHQCDACFKDIAI
jgi:hypothetical protein